MYLEAECPECGATLRVHWEPGDENISTLCRQCGAQPVWRAETDIVVNLGELLYDDRYAVRCATCPEWLDSRKAGQLNGKPACPRCVKYPPIAVVGAV